MTDWASRLVEVNDPGGNGKVVLAHLHPSETSVSFERSKMQMILADQATEGRLITDDGHLAYLPQLAGAGRLGAARNMAVSQFLDRHDAEWLLIIDSDMGFPPELMEQLVRSADPAERPVMGGLAFASRFYGMGRDNSFRNVWQPTLYTRVAYADGGVSWDPSYDYAANAVVKVDGTGAACLLIHRTVLEQVRQAEGDRWFTPILMPGADDHAGEDISFFERLHALEVPVHVNTAAKTNHHKDVWYTEADYLDHRAPASAAVTVVIPVKDNLDYTRKLVGQLFEQGGYTDVLIFDNGSETPEMREWLEGQGAADVFDASEASGIHEMWNAGIDEAVRRHRGMADVVLLNNDLSVGHRFCRRLIRGLRSDPMLMAVSGNYDHRPGSGVQPVRGICAGRYDGSGGLAGFAFALRAEWIASGYRFPADMAWWYGDNDLCLEIEKAGGWYGVALDSHCEHLDGGSRTEVPEGWAEQIARDRAAFEAKWPDVTLTAA